MGKASDAAERLMGTCDDGGEETEDLTPAELEEFDQLVFRCACGWWCEIGEMSPDGEHCDDCLDEGEE